MPRYDYKCMKCGEVAEVRHSMSDVGLWVGHDHLTWSPVISHKPLRDCFPMTRLIGAAMIAPDGTYSHKT